MPVPEQSISSSVPSLVVGTAGHIDHGKSSLVWALTGTDPDRLPEEKRRGITLELGFAHARLAPDVDASFVDVPGHERLVRTMVAGAQGVDVALLVVAADAGIQPQTLEHVDICRFLAVPRAVIAVTKVDRSEADPAGVVEAVGALRRSWGEPFADAPIVPVSARTGQGLDALRAALARQIAAVGRLRGAPAAFLPLDRAFALGGHGTVVTGTLAQGRLWVGEAVEVVVPHPGRSRVLTSRVRSLQRHGSSLTEVEAGQRVAANLPGIEVSEVPRGSVLVSRDQADIVSGMMFDVEVELLPEAPRPGRGGGWTLHLGTATALARVDPLVAPDAVLPRRFVAQMRLDRSLAAFRGQRGILRATSPSAQGTRTVGGVRILWRDEVRRRRRDADRAFLAALAGSDGEALRAWLVEAGLRGVPVDEAERRLSAVVDAEVERSGTTLWTAGTARRLASRVIAWVTAEGPLPASILRQRLWMESEGRRRGEVSDALWRAVADALGPQWQVAESVSRAGVSPSSAPALSGLALRVCQAVRAGGVEALWVDELVGVVGASATEVRGALRELTAAGQVVRVNSEYHLDSELAWTLAARVQERLGDGAALTAGEIRALAASTRKYVIPLCEWLDREGITRRDGDLRRRGPRTVDERRQSRAGSPSR